VSCDCFLPSTSSINNRCPGVIRAQLKAGEKGIGLFFYWPKEKEILENQVNLGVPVASSQKKKREKIARLVYLVPISNQKFRRMIKNLCFISGL
jgi:hypothetical protein